MGMTIDEAIRRIDEHNYIHQYKEPRAVYITEAFDVAVEAMRKYQKMQEILEKVWNIPSCMIDKAECLDKIMETYRTVRCDSSKKDVPTVTEQDIAKPYLVAVKEEAEKLKQRDNCTFDSLIALDNVIQFIDNLLEE